MQYIAKAANKSSSVPQAAAIIRLSVNRRKIYELI
jgi:hypothetical protein